MNHIIASKCFSVEQTHFCSRYHTLNSSARTRVTHREAEAAKRVSLRTMQKEETPAQKNRKHFFLSSVKISGKLSTSISSSLFQPWLFTSLLYAHSNFPFAFPRLPHSLSSLQDDFTKLQSTTELHPNIRLNL